MVLDLEQVTLGTVRASRVGRAFENTGDDLDLPDLLEIRGVDDPDRGYPIRDDFDGHLAHVEQNGSGGHNHEERIAWLEAQGDRATYTVTQTSTPGIRHITGTVTMPNGREWDFETTTYDPAVYVDARMSGMGRDAGRIGWDRFQAGDLPERGSVSGSAGYEVETGGVRFLVWVGPERGTQRRIVGAVHPIPAVNEEGQ